MKDRNLQNIDSLREEIEELRAEVTELRRIPAARMRRAFAHLTSSGPARLVLVAAIVAFAAASYAATISLTHGGTQYINHLMRRPALRTDINDSISRSVVGRTQGVFRWGAILANVFDPHRPLERRTESRVNEVLQAVREHAPRSEFYVDHLGVPPLRERGNKIEDDELAVLDTLRKARVALRYTDTTRPAKLAAWLRTITAGRGPLVSLSVELVTGTFQPHWMRGAESAVRLKFRRNTFWDVLCDPGIRGAISQRAKS